MIPPIATIAPQFNPPLVAHQQSKVKNSNPASISNWIAPTPLTSSELNSTPAPQLVAQELPGGSTPTPPTEPQNRPNITPAPGSSTPTPPTEPQNRPNITPAPGSSTPTPPPESPNRPNITPDPGGSTPPPPPSPETPNRPNSIPDKGQGYPTRLPANYFGPALGFGNGTTSFGVISKFPLGDKFSIRPSAQFSSRGTVLRVPVTYDFALGDPEPFEPNPLVTFHAGGGVEFSSGGGTVNGDKFSLLGTLGVDVSLFENIALLADFNTNFSSNSGITLGVGFQF